MTVSPRLKVRDQVVLDFAAEVGSEGPVAVEGARTRWELGGPSAQATRLIGAPTGIVEYIPDEMTVAVRCGTPVAELHAALADKGQRTALPERGGTVGGALAAGENSIHVAGRGRVREAALQIRYVSDEGAVVTAGGPTVKNVTGFDLPRLLVGSLGTLGLMADTILRTNPIPAVTRWLMSEDADPFAVPNTVLRPSCTLWNGTTTWVELEGHARAVDAEQAKLAAIGRWTQTEGPPDLPEHRWSLPPAELNLSRCEVGPSGPSGASPSHESFGDSFIASVGVGTVWASEPQPERLTDPATRVLNDRVKGQFDSRHRLNPGRVPGVR